MARNKTARDNHHDASELIPLSRIRQSIILIGGQRVMLDSDLAELYDVETGALTRAVRRNIARFPPDFTFQLTEAEFADLKRQTGISSSWGGWRRWKRSTTSSSKLSSMRSVS